MSRMVLTIMAIGFRRRWLNSLPPANSAVSKRVNVLDKVVNFPVSHAKLT